MSKSKMLKYACIAIGGAIAAIFEDKLRRIEINEAVQDALAEREENE